MEKRTGSDMFYTAPGIGPVKDTRRAIPPLVVRRAKSAGAAGEAWLAGLDGMISELEEMWSITVGEALSGGTHAFVAHADGRNGEKYVLKIDMPENLGGEFSNSVAALGMADGHGYAKLYAYDPGKKACLLERLGKPISQLGYSVYEQLRIICAVLQKSWDMPAVNTGFPGGKESVTWFREFIEDSWRKLNFPCPHGVIRQALCCLQSRERAMDPAGFVLLHGDAHGGNTLREMSGEGFKLIDPDGIFYEKAYDLGVLMREWVDEYEANPLEKGKERCRYLHGLTDVPEQAIWEWGYLQMVSTAFVLLQIGQEETGRKMLHVAVCWACENTEAAPARAPDYTDELTGFLLDEYGLAVQSIAPARRGFYGKTWRVETDGGIYFVKVDDWEYHRESYRNSLPVVQYMTGNGIHFIPKVVKTKRGQLYSSFRQGVAAVFEYVQGTPVEACPVRQLYGHLAKVYQLKADGIGLETETFGIEMIHIFQNLQNAPRLPAEAKKALAGRQTVILSCAERLKQFSAACKGDGQHFCITHGDAGGNCILSGNQLFIVDWDSVKLAPIERDAWVFICDKKQLDEIESVLAENGVYCSLEKNRLCYYCYYFFFYYLNEYLRSIISADNKEQKEAAAEGLNAFLAESWIYKRLDAAAQIT